MSVVSVYSYIDMKMISDSLLSSRLHTAIPNLTNTHILKIEKSHEIFNARTSHVNINIHSGRLL